MAVRRVTKLEKNPVRISKDEAEEQQAHSMIPKTERYTNTLKQSLTRQIQKVKHECLQQKSHERKRLYTNACGKERKNRPQMPVAIKKDQTTNAGGK